MTLAAAAGPPEVGVVLANVAFVAGALVVMVLLSAIVVLRQRKPKSVEANVESFNRGLRALAPIPVPPGTEQELHRRPPAMPTGSAPPGSAPPGAGPTDG